MKEEEDEREMGERREALMGFKERERKGEREREREREEVTCMCVCVRGRNP